MALDAVEVHQVRFVTDAADAVRELMLLVDREQDVGLRADDESAL